MNFKKLLLSKCQKQFQKLQAKEEEEKRVAEWAAKKKERERIEAEAAAKAAVTVESLNKLDINETAKMAVIKARQAEEARLAAEKLVKEEAARIAAAKVHIPILKTRFIHIPSHISTLK